MNLEYFYLGWNCYFGNICNKIFDIEDGIFERFINLKVLLLFFNNFFYVLFKLLNFLREFYFSNIKIKNII